MTCQLSILSAVTRGILWMVAAAGAFAVLLVSVRELSATFTAVEIVFVRALVGILFIFPIVARSGVRVLKTTRFPMHALRTVFAFFGMLLFFYSVAYIEVAQAMALTSSIAYAGAWTTVKILSRTESAAVIVFYMNVMMVPLTLVPALFVWVTPGWADVPALLVMALSGWAAHFCQARSFAAADASAVMPFDFLRLPFGALLAFALFGELSDAWTWAGAAVIFASTYYSTWRESRLARANPAGG